MTRRGLLLFLGLSLAWGIPYALTKIALTEFSPEMLVLARTALAALLLLPLAGLRHQLLPVVRHWRPLLAFAVVEIAVPWFFLNSAQERLPSSTVGLILATVPLAGLGVAFLMHRSEPMTARNWLGIVLGLAGVAAIVGLDVGGTDLIGVALLLVVIVGYALGPAILARWMPDLPGTGVMAVALAGVAVGYLPVVAATGGWPGAWPSASVLVSLVVLAVVCTAAAFLLLFALVAEVGPVRSTTITYVAPAIAVVTGALLLGETITAWTVLGFGLVVAGSALVQRRRPQASVEVSGPEVTRGASGVGVPAGESDAPPSPSRSVVARCGDLPRASA